MEEQNILKAKILSGHITTEAQLKTAFRALSKKLHPDRSGGDHGDFSRLLDDRQEALELLGSYASDPSMPKKDFWEELHRFLNLPRFVQYPSRDLVTLIKLGNDHSPGFGKAIQMYHGLYKKPDKIDLNYTMTPRMFFSGAGNFFSYLSSGQERDRNLAQGYLRDCIDRITKKPRVQDIVLLPLAWYLYTDGLGEPRGESGPDELLYSTGIFYWQKSSPSGWLETDLGMGYPVPGTGDPIQLGNQLLEGLRHGNNARMFFSFLVHHYSDSPYCSDSKEKLLFTEKRISRYTKHLRESKFV